MGAVYDLPLKRSADKVGRLRIMQPEVRSDRCLIKVGVAVTAAVRAGIVGADVIPEEAAALLPVLLPFLIGNRCGASRPFLHAPF